MAKVQPDQGGRHGDAPSARPTLLDGAGSPADHSPARHAPNPLIPIDADSAEWLRVTLSSIGDGVITADHLGRVSFLNPVAQALTGWTHEQAVGRPLEQVFNIVNEATRAKVENPALRALRDGTVVGLANHTLLISRDGTERPIDDSAAPIRNAKGDTNGAVLVFRDITERYAAERALRDSEVRYRRLFQTAKDGILILDASDGKIVDANGFMTGLTGLEYSDLLGKELYQIGMFKDIAENKAAFKQLQQTGYLRHEHLPMQNTRGDQVHIEMIANTYQEDGHLVAQCNIRDISDRVAMEQQIARQTEILANESRRKDEFLAMLSHELRNPLAPIRSAVHLLRLQEKGASENLIQKQAHEIIERQVASLTKLVSDLLEVSRVVSGKIRLNLQVVDLNQILHHAVETAKPLIDQRRHKLVLHLCDQPIWANADATRIEEVLINLLNNAAKYTPDAGKIEVFCERPRGTNYAQIRVRDNGEGIEQKLLPRIFDLFTQADRSLARSAGGLGIGLSLVQRLTDLHGGTVEAHSPPESAAADSKGSEFIVRLPLTPPPPLQVRPATREESASKTDALRILLVDDNIDLVLMLSSALRHQGHTVQVAYTGPDGLRLAQQWRPDVVLLDIGLPGLDGYEIARRLRADPALRNPGHPLKIIAVTGYGRDSDKDLAREAGFDGHLVKPVDFKDLEQMIASPAAEGESR